jgi:hypothetical protein
MTKDDLTNIADNTTFLYERLAGRWVADETLSNRQAAQTRLERWCQLAAGGDWSRFAQRLAWDGLDVDSALHLLCDGHLAEAEAEALPPWTGILAEVFQRPSDPSSFVRPFVEVAEAWLQQAVGDSWAWLASPAQAKLTGYLAEQLTVLARSALESASLSGQSGLARLLAEIGSGEDQADADSGNGPAVSALTEIRRAIPGITSPHAICRAYPVLARQLCTVAIQWVGSVQEFLSRLVADWTDLCQLTGEYARLAQGSVVNLHPGLSDPHRGGRTVWRVTLANGVTIAYKPKSLVGDSAWNALLDWCNQQGLSPRLGTLWVLPRAGYGWMEWAEPADSSEKGDRLLLHRRMGLLLGPLRLCLDSTLCRQRGRALSGRRAKGLGFPAQPLRRRSGQLAGSPGTDAGLSGQLVQRRCGDRSGRGGLYGCVARTDGCGRAGRGAADCRAAALSRYPLLWRLRPD